MARLRSQARTDEIVASHHYERNVARDLDRPQSEIGIGDYDDIGLQAHQVGDDFSGSVPAPPGSSPLEYEIAALHVAAFAHRAQKCACEGVDGFRPRQVRERGGREDQGDTVNLGGRLRGSVFYR
ncbi:MAG: hypothetical protein ACT4P4_04040 [Betaproteobacteria bacterium]